MSFNFEHLRKEVGFPEPIESMDIEAREFQTFQKKWASGELKGLRYGQAFYNYFKMFKMIQQDWMGKLYEADVSTAVKILEARFRLH